jgi:hypothetical protein
MERPLSSPERASIQLPRWRLGGVRAVLTVVIYRLVVQGWMEGIMPHVLAAGLAWALAAAVVVLAAVGVLGELRGAA